MGAPCTRARCLETTSVIFSSFPTAHLHAHPSKCRVAAPSGGHRRRARSAKSLGRPHLGGEGGPALAQGSANSGIPGLISLGSSSPSPSFQHTNQFLLLSPCVNFHVIYSNAVFLVMSSPPAVPQYYAGFQSPCENASFDHFIVFFVSQGSTTRTPNYYFWDLIMRAKRPCFTCSRRGTWVFSCPH